MDGYLNLIRTITELGSFALVVAAVLLYFLRVQPSEVRAREKVAESIRAALLEQRAAHTDERRYLREVQERQHGENNAAIRDLARSINRVCSLARSRRPPPPSVDS